MVSVMLSVDVVPSLENMPRVQPCSAPVWNLRAVRLPAEEHGPTHSPPIPIVQRPRRRLASRLKAAVRKGWAASTKNKEGGTAKKMSRLTNQAGSSPSMVALTQQSI